MTLIECRDAAFSREGHVLLSGLNFSVQSGELVCVMGENGAGKTTLLYGVLGQLAPCAGMLSLAPALAKGGIGYVPQYSTAQLALPASVQEIVRSGRIVSGSRLFYSPADRAAAQAQLCALGLSALAKRPFSALSGGQQRRVLLARALCAAQSLLLLDEPLAGLDEASAGQLWAALAHYTAQGGGVLMVTHDHAGAAAHAQRILCLGDGRQLSFGAAAGGCAE